MNIYQFDLSKSELGKQSNYRDIYAPEVLFAMPRSNKGKEQHRSIVAFCGADIWNAYEISWLNSHGKPEVRIGRIAYEANSDFMLESKSLKLYLNSFNNTVFKDEIAVQEAIIRDIGALLQTKVSCELHTIEAAQHEAVPQVLQGVCLDDLDIAYGGEEPKTMLEEGAGVVVAERLYTHLLRSNCPSTGQPDFGSLLVRYSGRKISSESLLKYVISLRNHQEFHEQCIERIFAEIWVNCAPEALLVAGYYTRRGGIEINPIRALQGEHWELEERRTIRQ